jgi:hypothetical protein
MHACSGAKREDPKGCEEKRDPRGISTRTDQKELDPNGRLEKRTLQGEKLYLPLRSEAAQMGGETDYRVRLFGRKHLG